LEALPVDSPKNEKPRRDLIGEVDLMLRSCMICPPYYRLPLVLAGAPEK
jgi:hypothetical protein